jgi:MFS family permease
VSDASTSGAAGGATGDPRRWRMLALLSLAELLGMSVWFAASAVAPELAARWGLDPGATTAWLMTSVQIGFVVGTAAAALLNLADVLPSKRYFAGCAALAALANGALLVAPGFVGAVALRFATGICLAGVYPPAMKMVATWFRSARGLAIGTVVGALTIGKATPFLVHALPRADVVGVVVATSSAALLAAALVTIGYADGPHAFPSRPFSWGLATTVLRERRWRLATGGYLGHMFELYSFWTWIPAFVAASFAMRAGLPAEALDGRASARASLLAFGIIAVGGIGCVWGGLVADRIGRERLVTIAMAASGACALLVGTTFGRAWWLLAPVALAWGFFVIADSAQFSALVTESVPPHAVGTALTIQTSLGFLLTTVTIQAIPPMVALVGWRWAFVLLALGPALGIAAIARLRHVAPFPAAVAGGGRG